MIHFALRGVLGQDPRSVLLFALWDKYFRESPSFIVSPFVDLGVRHGLLRPDEKLRLHRAIFAAARLRYDELEPYPDGIVVPVTGG